MPIRRRNDEFDHLSTTLNQMLDHIARLMNSLRHISADIAHDLRHPLARVRGKLERALHSEDAAEQRAAIVDALERMDDALDLFATILRISEVEAGGLKQWFKPVALAPLVVEITAEFETAALEGGQKLTVGHLAEATVHGSEELIGQALANLIENCLKHCPPGTSVGLDLTAAADGTTELTVRDNGPGIPASQHALVLERFGRAEASRTKTGYGLGLTMVQSIAVAHGASLLLDDAGPGLIVRLIFPPKV